MVWWLMRGYEVEAIAICIYSYIYISKAGKNERNVGDTNSAWLNGFYRLWLLSDVSYQWLRLFIVSAARCFHQEHYGLPEDSERHGPLWCNLGQTKHGRKERFLCWGLQDTKLYKADHSGKLLPIITTELGAFKGSLEYSPGIGDCPDGTVPWQKITFWDLLEGKQLRHWLLFHRKQRCLFRSSARTWGMNLNHQDIPSKWYQ